MVNNYSLRTRLLTWVLGSNIALWGVSGLIMWYEAKHEMEQLLEHLLDGTFTAEKFQHERLELLQTLALGLVWPLVAVLPLLALVIAYVIYRANRNLTALGNDLANRTALSFEPVKVELLPIEVVPVVNQLNNLFRRMKNSVENEQRFTSAAAHELRTPIAAIRAQAQVASMSVDPADRQHALKELMISCDRSGHLIDQLLALARIENSAHVAPVVETFDLLRTLRTTVAMVITEAQAKNQTLSFDSASDLHKLMVRGNDALVGTLLRNLIENAIRYSHAGASILVTVNVKAGKPCVIVEDNGPGMTQAEIAQLGEKFFRAQNTTSTGSGLGWSIVRQIASSEHLAIDVCAASQQGGLRVTVCFPS